MTLPVPVTLKRFWRRCASSSSAWCRRLLVSWRARRARGQSCARRLRAEVARSPRCRRRSGRAPAAVSAGRRARLGAACVGGCRRLAASAASCRRPCSAPRPLGLRRRWPRPWPRPSSWCGPRTMIMLRPSCFGEDSTKPSSWMSSASRCSSRKPSSGRDCSRPRNMIVTLTLSPCLEEPHDVALLGLVVVRVDLRPELHLLDDRVAPGSCGPHAPSERART